MCPSIIISLWPGHWPNVLTELKTSLDPIVHRLTLLSTTTRIAYWFHVVIFNCTQNNQTIIIRWYFNKSFAASYHLAPGVVELIWPDVMLRVDDIDWRFVVLASLRPWNVYLQHKCNIISVFNFIFFSASVVKCVCCVWDLVWFFSFQFAYALSSLSCDMYIYQNAHLIP